MAQNPAAPTPTTTPSESNGLANTAKAIGNFCADNPIIPILLVLWIAALYGWKQLRTYYAQRGKPVAPLGAITGRVLRFAFKEDTAPLLTRPKKIATRTQALTGRRLYLGAATTATIGHLTGLITPALPLAIGAYILATRARRTFKQRWLIQTQMFAVASGECRYPKGAELNPWAYINIQNWEGPTRPGTTIVTYPAAYQSEDNKTRQKFEIQFGGTVSDEHGWEYKWESSKNRVICTPAPYLPSMVKYPGSWRGEWDKIPIGMIGEGKEAVIDLANFPHALICGPTGSGKAYALSSSVPTPTGWTSVGEVQVGDQVFDSNGNPCNVTGLSPIFTDHQAYDVVFSDGSVLRADAEHLWWTETRAVRESRWTAARRPASREPLLNAEARARLLGVAGSLSGEAEISIREVAELAGVAPETGWLQDLAREIGQVAEAQIATLHHYGAQVVEQEQSVRLYPARTALLALADFRPAQAPVWDARRPEAQALAERAAVGERVSSRQIAAVLGVPSGKVGSALRQAGLESTTGTDGLGKGNVRFWDAKAAWGFFGQQKVPSWFHLRDKCREVAETVDEGAEWSLTRLSEFLGTERHGLAALLRRLNVPVRLSRETLSLVVSEKSVLKASPWTRLFPAQRLLEAVAEYGTRTPYDQRFKQAMGGVRTTEEIRETLRTAHGHANHSVPVAHALMLPEADLPMAPYTFGVWLGDGTSWSGEFCGIDHEIARLVEADGYTLSERTVKTNTNPNFRLWSILGSAAALRHLGVLKTHVDQGRTKRIPMVYLRASRAQRAALLAGLLDTDGTVGDSGSVEITQISEGLACDIRELACTLGYRAVIREGRATFEGRDYGPAWTVSWTCDESPFRISRKTAALRERSRFSAERNDRRYIVDVRPVPPEPMRCLMVDSSDHLFLVGDAFIPTHNSVLQRMILFHALQHDDEWKIVGVDPKMVEMGWLKKYPSVLSIALTLEEGVEVVRSVRDEMMRRYDEMAALGVNNAKNLDNPPPALMLMIDETFNFLSPEGVKSDEGKERDQLHAEAQSLLGEIARLGRAARCHLFAATQRPDATVIKGEFKNNLDCRIAAGRLDTTPSMMVLDSEAATRLPKVKGRGMIRLGGEMDTFQGYFAEQEWYDGFLAAREAGSLPDGPGAGVPVPAVGGLVGKLLPASVSSLLGVFVARRAAAAAADAALDAVAAGEGGADVESGGQDEGGVSRLVKRGGAAEAAGRVGGSSPDAVGVGVAAEGVGDGDLVGHGDQGGSDALGSGVILDREVMEREALASLRAERAVEAAERRAVLAAAEQQQPSAVEESLMFQDGDLEDLPGLVDLGDEPEDLMDPDGLEGEVEDRDSVAPKKAVWGKKPQEPEVQSGPRRAERPAGASAWGARRADPERGDEASAERSARGPAVQGVGISDPAEPAPSDSGPVESGPAESAPVAPVRPSVPGGLPVRPAGLPAVPRPRPGPGQQRSSSLPSAPVVRPARPAPPGTPPSPPPVRRLPLVPPGSPSASPRRPLPPLPPAPGRPRPSGRPGLPGPPPGPPSPPPAR